MDAVGSEFPDYLEQLLGTSPVVRRLQLVSRVFDSARLLWVDDQPRNNTYEAMALRALGVEIEQVYTSAEALARVKTRSYDVVLSDIAHDDNPSAGLDMLQTVRQLMGPPPVIFYVQNLDAARGTPAGAQGITTRPDELFHFIADVLERRRL